MSDLFDLLGGQFFLQDLDMSIGNQFRIFHQQTGIGNGRSFFGRKSIVIYRVLPKNVSDVVAYLIKIEFHGTPVVLVKLG